MTSPLFFHLEQNIISCWINCIDQQEHKIIYVSCAQSSRLKDLNQAPALCLPVCLVARHDLGVVTNLIQTHCTDNISGSTPSHL